MAIEAFEFHEESRFRKIAVDHADRVIGIECADKMAADGFHSLHVSWRDKTGSTDKGKRLRLWERMVHDKTLR
jgi:hypothetical protein